MLCRRPVRPHRSTLSMLLPRPGHPRNKLPLRHLGLLPRKPGRQRRRPRPQHDPSRPPPRRPGRPGPTTLSTCSRPLSTHRRPRAISLTSRHRQPRHKLPAALWISQHHQLQARPPATPWISRRHRSQGRSRRRTTRWTSSRLPANRPRHQHAPACPHRQAPARRWIWADRPQPRLSAHQHSHLAARRWIWARRPCCRLRVPVPAARPHRRARPRWI